MIGPIRDVPAPEPAGQQALEFVAGYFAGAQTGQMPGILLAVDDLHLVRSAKGHQRRQRNF